MTQQIINIGLVADDGTGDNLRTAFDKTNRNFTELYAGAGTSPPPPPANTSGLVNINDLLTTPLNPDGETSNLPMIREFNQVVQKFAPEFPVAIILTVGNPTFIELNPDAAAGAGGLTDHTHYLKPNQAFKFKISAGGSLPSGIDTTTTCYVTAANLSAPKFTFSTVNNYGYDTLAGVFTNEGPPVATSGSLVGTASIVLTGRDVNIFIPQGPYFGATYGSGLSEFLTPNGLTRVRYEARGAMFDSGISFGARHYTAEAKTWTRVFSKVQTTPTMIGAAPPFDAIVRLLNPAEASNFYINGWVTVLGLDMQDRFGTVVGEPPNNHFQEYKRIKAINAVTGDITLDGALKWVYLSTFPDVSQATSPGLIGGGPAIIAPMHPNWDTEITIVGGRYCGEAPEAFGRRVTFEDFAFQGYYDFPGQAVATGSQSYIYRKCQFGPGGGSPYFEIDKMIESLEFDTCTSYNSYRLLFQSPSVHLCVIRRHQGGLIEGTPRQMLVDSSEMEGIKVGPFIGVTDSLAILNSRFTYVDILDRNDDNDNLSHGNDMQLVPNWSFSDGTFTRNISNIGNQAANWIIPGAKIYMTDAGNVFKRYQNMGSMFAILNTTMDGAGNLSFKTTLKALPTRTTSFTISSISIATPAVITTSAPHGFVVGTPVVFTTTGVLPTPVQTGNQYYVAASPAPGSATFSVVTTIGGGGTAVATSGSQSGTHTAWGYPLCFRPHPCTNYTGIGNGGCPAIIDHNGAIEEPLYSRIRRGFGGIQGDISGSGPGLQAPNPRIWGFLKSMVVTVFAPASVGTLTITSVGFQQPNLDLGTGGNFSQTINVATAGQRIVTNLAVTGNQTGDVLAAYPHWLAGPVLFNWSTSMPTTLGASPAVLVEMFTDQGIARFSNMWGSPSAPLATFNLWAWTHSGTVQQYGSSP